MGGIEPLYMCICNGEAPWLQLQVVFFNDIILNITAARCDEIVLSLRYNCLYYEERRHLFNTWHTSTQTRSFKSVSKNKNTGNIQGLDAKYIAESLIINSIFRVP
jgi:hypothetical protein